METWEAEIARLKDDRLNLQRRIAALEEVLQQVAAEIEDQSRRMNERLKTEAQSPIVHLSFATIYAIQDVISIPSPGRSRQ